MWALNPNRKYERAPFYFFVPLAPPGVTHWEYQLPGDYRTNPSLWCWSLGGRWLPPVEEHEGAD